MFSGVYKNRRVLVTGHTGFKGSWLVKWLTRMGAQVSGISLAPETTPNHWELLELDINSLYLDIRDESNLRKATQQADPEIVFHLAAQPLVRRSYQNPLETWATNVMGTANILDACRGIERLAAIVVVTTDKCYENQEWPWGYRENDRLGGHDPYSASKAGSELVCASFRAAFFNTTSAPLLATARAGNVIGGGDWSEDRLIPDLVRSISAGKSLEIRSPLATRPWQHVLECLSGYLILGQELLSKNKTVASAWNFGPDKDGNRQVKDVLEALIESWPTATWHQTTASQPHEAQLLHLDSSKATTELSWRPVWSFEEAIAATATWYRTWTEQHQIATGQQLQHYIERARDKDLSWAQEP